MTEHPTRGYAGLHSKRVSFFDFEIGEVANLDEGVIGTVANCSQGEDGIHHGRINSAQAFCAFQMFQQPRFGFTESPFRA